LKEKLVMQELRNGREKADVCQEFGLINSIIPMTWKNRTTVISVKRTDQE